MSIYLLANIGTRDVQLDTFTDLPPEIVNARGDGLIPRLAGEYLRQPEHFERFQQRLRLPMLEKALRFITAKPDATIRVVLFATNQSERVQASYRNNDTIHLANLIRDVLFNRHSATGLAKKHIEIRLTDQNPADYDLMYEFYRHELPTIAAHRDSGSPIYLLIAGGTPQMNTMLLLIGAEVFSGAAMPLYASQDLDRAHQLDITRQLYRQAFQRSLEVVLQAYSYSPALNLLHQNRSFLEQEQASLLEAAIHYAIHRRNLDLVQAIKAFDATIANTRALREMVRSLQQELADQSEEVQLRETVFLAQIAARTENWADFLARLHRFSEGCMQLIAEQLGVAWSDKKTRASFAKVWWNMHRSELAAIGLAESEEPMSPEQENKSREVDRTKLRAIIDILAYTPEHEPIRQAIATLKVIDAPIPLRNNIVHRFTPISQSDVEEKARVPIDELLAAMRLAYYYAFGQLIADESPYDSINRLCGDILKGMK